MAREVIGGRKSMTSSADDHHVIRRLRRRIDERGRPSALSLKAGPQERKTRVAPPGSRCRHERPLLACSAAQWDT